MGERLNIEIIKNGETLANAYYHWSGYSNSAVELAKDIIKEYSSIDRNQSDLLQAIRLLESSGAGLTDRELEYANTIDELKDIKFAECNGCNDGLIGISKNEINQIRKWQEHAIYIYLDEERMNYQVFWKSKKWEYEEDYSECDNFVKFDDLEKVNINFDDIKFSEIDSFVDFINAHLENRFVSNMDGWSVISMIY